MAEDGNDFHHATRGSEDGLALWCEWSAGGTKYEYEDLEAHWLNFKPHLANPETIASLRREAVAASEDIPAGTIEEPRPVVQVKGGELHNYAAQCEALLRDELYVRARSLVRIGGAQEMEPEPADDIRRDRSQAVIIPASTEYVRRRLNQLARFETYRRREKESVPVDCPKDLALNIAGQGDWPKLKRLEAIARAPFVRSDGTICEVPGYDPESRVFYVPTPFPVHLHMLRHACGFKLANDSHDTGALQLWLGHKNIQHTVRYTELSPARFKNFWRD
jgi:hypothetical protein